MKKLKSMKKYLKGKYWLLTIAFLCILISNGTKLAIPFLAGKAVNIISQTDSATFRMNSIQLYIILMVSFCIIGAITRYIFDYCINYVGQDVVKEMRIEVFNSFMNAPLSYLDNHSNGDLLLRVISDVENVQNGVILGSGAFLNAVVALILTTVFMFSINWALALVVLALTPISILISRGIAKFNNKHFKGQAKMAGSINAYTLETLNNSECIKTLNAEEDRKMNFDEISEEYRQSIFKANMGASIINPSTRLVNNIINTALIITGSLFIVKNINTGVSFGVGDLSSFLMYASSFMWPINEMSDVVADIKYAVASYERIEKAINCPVDIDEGTQEISGDVDSVLANNVTFSYDESKTILDNFTLDIYKGHKIALVGPTGSGKTTIINLLMRFYDPQQGAFYINDISTQDIKKDSLRSNVGMVLQDTWIFHGTIFENIAYGKENATLEEVKLAAKKAQADNFIMNLPEQYETPISANCGLSKGEMQLICVARLMMMNPQLIVLDEATSNIDIRTEYLLNKSFAELMNGKTCVIVAHRLSTIVNADYICVLKDGKLIEQGNHNELINKHGFYYDLYNAQFKQG